MNRLIIGLIVAVPFSSVYLYANNQFQHLQLWMPGDITGQGSSCAFDLDPTELFTLPAGDMDESAMANQYQVLEELGSP